jgi:hypothetical protein
MFSISTKLIPIYECVDETLYLKNEFLNKCKNRITFGMQQAFVGLGSGLYALVSKFEL